MYYRKKNRFFKKKCPVKIAQGSFVHQLYPFLSGTNLHRVLSFFLHASPLFFSLLKEAYFLLIISMNNNQTQGLHHETM